MKKSNHSKITKKLALHKEVLRSLRDADLMDAAGGKPNPTVSLCVTECFPTRGVCTGGNTLDCTL